MLSSSSGSISLTTMALVKPMRAGARRALASLFGSFGSEHRRHEPTMVVAAEAQRKWHWHTPKVFFRCT